MSKSKKDRLNFVNTPIYFGGSSAMKKFLSKNLRYPKEAIENKIEGTVSLKYDIDYKGKVINTHILAGIGHGCDQEASRIVKMLKFDIKRAKKIKVVYHKNIKIHFKLPKEKQISINYNYTSSQDDKLSGYDYSIKF